MSRIVQEAQMGHIKDFEVIFAVVSLYARYRNIKVVKQDRFSRGYGALT